MRKLVLMLVCVFATLTAAAQTKMSWSVELGLGVSSWMGKNADGANGLFNPKVGVGLDIPLTNLISFQTGLDWVSKGAKHDAYFSNDVLGKDLDVKVNQNYFHLPMLAAFHLGTGTSFDVVLKAGAYMAVGVCGKSEVDYDDMTVSWNTFKDSSVEGMELPTLHRFDAGIQTGVDLDFPTWKIGVEGEFGLCKVASGDAPHNLGVFVTAGYKF